MPWEKKAKRARHKRREKIGRDGKRDEKDGEMTLVFAVGCPPGGKTAWGSR